MSVVYAKVVNLTEKAWAFGDKRLKFVSTCVNIQMSDVRKSEVWLYLK
ncbi:hypothetical protein GCM10022289_31780 [Pedobacter jeongneungensis]|uniref:Uncharacterized protein n=1 Tax=Pedobacter jeongneungensis TaxID=947309 RepID=A0ABP8BJC5_9SPHI